MRLQRPWLSSCLALPSVAWWQKLLGFPEVLLKNHGWFAHPETNRSHLQIDGWKDYTPFGKAYFQGQDLSFRECNSGFVKGFSDCKNGLLRFGLANYSSYNDGPFQKGTPKKIGFFERFPLPWLRKGNLLWWLSIDKQSFKQKWEIVMSNVGELV